MSIVALGTNLATAIGTLAVLVMCSALVAYVVARRYSRTRPRGKALFTVVAVLG